MYYIVNKLIRIYDENSRSLLAVNMTTIKRGEGELDG